MNVIYKDKIIKGQRIDIIVSDEVDVDVKSVRKPHEYWSAQVLSYLRSTGLTRGLIINFGMMRLVDGIQRFSL